MRDFLWVAKALADETRLRILLLLGSGELCVCQIIAVIGLAPSTISKHMALLHQAGLVENRKNGRWVHYSLSSGDEAPIVREALAWVAHSLAVSPTAQRDRATLKKVLSVEPEKLCEMQSRHGTGNPFAAADANNAAGACTRT